MEVEAERMTRREFHARDWARASGVALVLWTLGASADTSGPPICSGTLTYCRPCTTADEGQPMGCEGATPVCEVIEPNARFGYCVQCTSNANCSSTTPICTGDGPSTDTCRACSSDMDCTSQLLAAYCLPSGACSATPPAVTEPPMASSSCSTGGGHASWLASIVLLAFLLPGRPRAVPRTSFLAATELVSARRQAPPSRSPASDAMRSAKRCP